MIPSELATIMVYGSVTLQTLSFLICTVCSVRYGLGAAILSKDLERCERFTKVRVVSSLPKASCILTKRHCFCKIRDDDILLMDFAGFSVGDCLDQLFTAMLLATSMGWQKT